MKHLNRLTALCLSLALLLPAWLITPAAALDTPNVTKESYAFYQRASHRAPSAETQGEVDNTDEFYSAYQTNTYVREQASDAKTSWAIAAIAALDAAYGYQHNNSATSFSDTHMIFSLSNDTSNTLGFPRRYNEAGNRVMSTAYMMRGNLGGPVTGFPSYPGATSIVPQNLQINGANGQRHFISGVVYIPEAQATGGASASSLYIKRIKDAVYTHGAVAASLYMDPEYFFEGLSKGDYEDENGAKYINPMGAVEEIYHYPYRTAADHSVTIVGWNDEAWKYDVPTPTTDEPDKFDTLEHKGAFLVRDSMIDGGVEYWVSYETILSGAFYVEGFLDEELTETYEATYEYDIFGANGAMGYNSASARFANVFTVNSPAEQLEAVSVFLTGESTSVSVYYVPDYKDTDDLKNALTKGVPLLTNATKPLPGYYCFPVEPVVLGAQGSKFALVAVAESSYSNSPIPVQSMTGATTGTGKSYISSNGDNWTDSYAQGQATVCLKAHANKDIIIPLTGASIAATDNPETKSPFTFDATGFGTLTALHAAPGLTQNIGPVYAPANATNVAKRATVWRFYDSEGNLLVSANKDSDSELRVEVPKTYAEDETKPSVPVFRFASGQLYIPADILTGSYTVEADIFTFASDDDKDKPEAERAVSATPFVTAQGAVVLRPVSVTNITIDKTEVTVKAGSTATIKATITPNDSSYKKVAWKVAGNYTKVDETYSYEPFTRGYDAGDPYHPEGPLVTVSETGKVTGLRDGVCYVYAEIMQENGVATVSPPCKITVSKSDPTGVSVAKKKLTMSNGTKYTIKATVKPASASNKRVLWSSADANIVSVDPILGIMEAKTPGVVSITATNALGETAVCEVTVSNAPSNTIKMSKSATLSLTGAKTTDEVTWEIVEEGIDQNVNEPLHNTRFKTATVSKNKLKLTAQAVGEVTIRAYISANAYDANGNETDKRPINEQTWRVSAVVPLTKLAMKNDAGETVTRVTICVDPEGVQAPESVNLGAVIVKPLDATLLDFEWKVNKDTVATVETVSGDNPNLANIRVSAVSTGTAKITGSNYNSNKKVSLTVKVMAYPTDIAYKKYGPLTLAIGKSVSLKAYATGPKGLNKTVQYSLEDAQGNPLPEKNGIATLGKNGKVKATGEGTVYLVARGAPYTQAGVTARIELECKTLVKKVTLSAPRNMAVGSTASLGVYVSPGNATIRDVTLDLSLQNIVKVTQDAQGAYSITANEPGRVKVTVASKDNPKKKKSVYIRVK